MFVVVCFGERLAEYGWKPHRDPAEVMTIEIVAIVAIVVTVAIVVIIVTVVIVVIVAIVVTVLTVVTVVTVVRVVPVVTVATVVTVVTVVTVSIDGLAQASISGAFLFLEYSSDRNSVNRWVGSSKPFAGLRRFMILRYIYIYIP